MVIRDIGNFIFHLTFAILAALLLSFHTVRIYYTSQTNNKSLNYFKILRYIDISQICTAFIIAYLIGRIARFIAVGVNFGHSDRICTTMNIFGMCITATGKCLLHVFIALRSVINVNEIKSIWFNIGLAFALSDILFVVWAVSGIPTIEGGIDSNGVCLNKKTHFSIFAWFAFADFLIGFYCLCVFVVPLWKIIKLEDEISVTNVVNEIVPQEKNNSIKSIVYKIIIFSSLAIASTMLTTILAATKIIDASYIFTIDGC